ncbi:hypothetical protein BDN67DRAFT_909816, partial [Paxillus ammoniavirescens]
ATKASLKRPFNSTFGLVGIILFLFCMRGNRVTVATTQNYILFRAVLDKKEHPEA